MRRLLLVGLKEFMSKDQCAYRVCSIAPLYTQSWATGTDKAFPSGYGLILQADRMQFLKGLIYAQTMLPLVISTGDPDKPMLDPYISLGQRWGQSTTAPALITSNYQTAIDMQNHFRANTTPPFTEASIYKNTYPIALTCGAYPINPDTAADTGCYVGNPDEWRTVYFSYDNSGMRKPMDVTCLGSTTKSCSDSNLFPRGFEAWRRNADLEGVLETTDAQPLAFDEISWDNMEALEEDAQSCGQVITDNPAPGQVDCVLDEGNGLTQYALGTGNPCYRFRKLDLNAVTWNGVFNPASYLTESSAKAYLRRVIYAKTPIEIEQKVPNGIFTNLTNNQARQNFSVWIVNEDTTRVRPFQVNTTNMDLSNPVPRKVYFNQAVNADETPNTAISSIQMVMMSPERPELILPGHLNMDLATFTRDNPLSAGVFKPRYYYDFDYQRHENEAYKFGVRDVHLVNLAMITSADTTALNPFHMVGMWSQSLDDWMHGVEVACLFDKPGDSVGYNALPPVASPPHSDQLIVDPATGRSVLPPANSKFYESATGPMPVPRLVPYIFHKQYYDGYTSSSIHLVGHRLIVPFQSGAVGGHRDMAVSKYKYGAVVPVDLSDHRFELDNGGIFRFHHRRTLRHCQCGLLKRLLRIQFSRLFTNHSLNKNIHDILSFCSSLVPGGVDGNMSGLGAIFYQELPTVQESP